MAPKSKNRKAKFNFILAGKELQEDSEIENKVVSQSTESNLYDSPPDDIENWNVVPAHRDIFRSNETFLRPNFVGCDYPDLETYKDVQFRLLMEDFMAPLRDGVAKYVNNNFGPKGIQELRIYEVISLKILHDRHFVPERETSWRFYSVQFKVSNRINWATSRRLINGSLVCLWDGVNELVIASVANSNPKDLALGRVVLVLETQYLPSYITKKYVMLESTVFFEPYRAVLKVLQNFTYETFPMMDYFLGFEKNQLAPSYIEKAPMFTLQILDDKSFTIRNMMDFAVWPDADKLGLDKRQHVALLTALTSRVSLVQGPPGTGKTFLALRILRSLLDNKNLWQGKFNGSQEIMLQQLKTTYGKNWYMKNKLFWKVQGAKWRDDRAPVVVICFTNHALDQFLEGISDWTDKIIRIGGQSKSTKLKDLNLNQIKHLAKSAHNNGPYKESTYFYYFHRMKEIRAKMEVVYDSIQSKTRVVQSKKGFKVDELQIKGIISSEICDEFKKAEQRQPKRSRKKSSNILDWWLGWSNHRQLLKLLRETRLDTRKAQIIKTSVEMKHEKVEEDLPDDIEVPDRTDDDIIEDLIDDEDYREELRLAKEQADVVASPEDVVDDKDEFQKRFDAAIDQHKEQSLIDFAKNQMQRMQLIHDLLLNRPPNTQFLDKFISADQILKLPLSQRWMLFAHWKRTYHDMIHKDLMDTQTAYEDRIKEFNQLKGEALAALCRTADVVGMTTTGAAKNRLLLESLKAKIVIVEEAAEVLESHIVCSLTTDCQQLILIGDHQQLRPSVNVHQLATKFKLDVSLFERLIKGDMKPAKLGVQHRMRAEVARLIVPVVYAHLENHPSVYGHPHVPGIQHDVFFYHHTNAEKEDGSSFFNPHEVIMALYLACYFVQEHGILPNRITILATYTAQLHQLLNLRGQNSVMKNVLSDVHITVVDNFQGEENDIIILSLVRNNHRNSVGFLRIDNRVCVALSRARNGLYILGNIQLLGKTSPLWAHIQQVLTENGQIGEEFPLRCHYHHQNILKVKKPEEFPTGSFCKEPCETLLHCGHLCQRICHSNGEHTIKCEKMVDKIFTCGHRQMIACSKIATEELCRQLVAMKKEPCMHEIQVHCSLLKSFTENVKCTHLMSKELPCGHSQQLRCCDPADPTLCQVQVEFQLICSHLMKIACGTPIFQRVSLNFYCQQPVRKNLPCGHLKMMPCRDNPLETECGRPEEHILDCGHKLLLECTGQPINDIVFQCMELVNNRLPCGHIQKKNCSRQVERCNNEVNRKLECGHTVKTPCWNQSPKCLAKVEKILMCGHKSFVPCSHGIDSIICTVQVKVIHPVCLHQQSVSCSTANDELELRLRKCEAEIMKTLNCGHESRLPCTQQIDNITCNVMVNHVLPCNHQVIIPCHSIASSVKEKCKLTCQVPLKCEHFCSLPCHDKKDAHFCNQTMEKQLECGHLMNMPCSRNATKQTCFAYVTFQRDCGHVLSTTCGNMAAAKESVCSEMKQKTLPCGHKVRVKCNQSIEKIICDQPDTQLLGCRHSVPTQCGVPLEKRLLLPCTEKETRLLPCGHSCEVKCGSKEAEKSAATLFCRTVVEKKIPQCGHTVQIECGKKLSKNECTSNCEKMLDCGHQCPLPCRDPCSTKSCRQQIELEDVKLPCGHFFRAECRLRYADRTVIEAKKIEIGKCRFRCPVKLACGHGCTSSCIECETNKFHSICTKPCDRILICGHKCEAQCGKACPPCKKPCNYRCSHQTCPLLCGDECLCMENCHWKCPHFQCNHPCYESCKREPCNEPCSKTLGCGHFCNGLCGEICPPKCHDCSRIRIPKYNETFRYIYLIDCEHWVEVNVMDEWMKNKKEGSIRKIGYPSYPQCQKAIRRSFRYGDQIKAFYVDLVSIKWEFFNNDFHSVKDSKIRRAAKKIDKLDVHASIIKEQKVAIDSIHQQIQLISNLSGDQRWDLVYRLQLVHMLCCLANDLKKKYVVVVDKNRNKLEEFSLDEASVQHLLNKVSKGFKFMKKHANSGQGYYIDLFNAATRFDLHRQYFVIETVSRRFFPNLRIDQRQLDQVSLILEGNQPWMGDDEDFVVNWLNHKSTLYNGINLSGSVMKDVQFIERLNMSSNNWFKCADPSCETVFSTCSYTESPECL